MKKRKFKRTGIGIALLMVALFCGPGYAGINDGLVAYYPLDDNIITGNVVDLSPNHNDAQIANAVPAADRYGRAGRAYSFNGSTSYLRKQSATGLNFNTTNQITIAAWFMLTAHSAYDGIVSLGSACHYRIMANSTTPPHPFYDPGTHTDQTVSGTNFSVGTNTWYHFAMTVQGGASGVRTATVYINGNPVQTITSSAIPATLPAESLIHIGVGESILGNQLQGSIDEVRIYNRVLSASEIQQLCQLPTLVELSSFEATPQANSVLLEWETASELDNAGFNLWRSNTRNGKYHRITDQLFPASGTAIMGASYSFEDGDVLSGKRYFYKLEDVDTYGISTFHGPVKVQMPR